MKKIYSNSSPSGIEHTNYIIQFYTIPFNLLILSSITFTLFLLQVWRGLLWKGENLSTSHAITFDFRLYSNFFLSFLLIPRSRRRRSVVGTPLMSIYTFSGGRHLGRVAKYLYESLFFLFSLFSLFSISLISLAKVVNSRIPSCIPHKSTLSLPLP